ncbi:MAG: patatin-like phospholipase family protein [Brumimicrobium sp.]|nr:patatin-like phospholipase family protein [Brumimicrobium sp.]
MNKLRIILSIDGGGIRGVLPLMILSELNRRVVRNRLCRNINECIDLSAGTSTGAIISAAMMLKNSGKYVYLPENILNLYISRGAQIFTVSSSPTKKDFPFKMILENNFGDISLKDLTSRFAFVSFDENRNEPFVFSNLKEEFRDVSLAKALLACSAVPEYFPPVPLGNMLLSDGIRTAKNPAEIALFHAQVFYPDDVFMLISLGTGKLSTPLYDDIEHEVDRVNNSLLEQARNNKKLIYYRFQPEINTANQEMDDATPENIENLMIDGENYISTNKHKLEQLVNDWKTFRL